MFNRLLIWTCFRQLDQLILPKSWVFSLSFWIFCSSFDTGWPEKLSRVGVSSIYSDPRQLFWSPCNLYSVSVLYGNIAIFRDLEAFLTQKVVGSQQNLQYTIGICPCFWSRPPGLSWIKRIGFLTFIACQSKTNGCFQNFPAVFSSSFIELQ